MTGKVPGLLVGEPSEKVGPTPEDEGERNTETQSPGPANHLNHDVGRIGGQEQGQPRSAENTQPSTLSVGIVHVGNLLSFTILT